MAKTNNKSKKNPKPQTNQSHHKPHSWAMVKSLFTCKHLQAQVQQEQPKVQQQKSKKTSNQRPHHHQTTIEEINKTSSYSKSPIVGSFRKLSGCYECRMVVDPALIGLTKDPSLTTTISSCPLCGLIFTNPQSLELHQALIHAVSELGGEDTSRNIVEIIFQSSWPKTHTPIITIHRILKVHNTPKSLTTFEQYRDNIKSKPANKKLPRCVADGNELLRFYPATLLCPLGLNGSSNLCNSIPHCEVCDVIKNGFGLAGKGIPTTATSWRAHVGGAAAAAEEERAMLVCRVIAGRVKRCFDGSLEEFDSVAGASAGGGGGGGGRSLGNLDELYVFDPKAVLPCFVVIYKGF